MSQSAFSAPPPIHSLTRPHPRSTLLHSVSTITHTCAHLHTPAPHWFPRYLNPCLPHTHCQIVLRSSHARLSSILQPNLPLPTSPVLDFPLSPAPRNPTSPSETDPEYCLFPVVVSCLYLCICCGKYKETNELFCVPCVAFGSTAGPLHKVS